LFSPPNCFSAKWLNCGFTPGLYGSPSTLVPRSFPLGPPAPPPPPLLSFSYHDLSHGLNLSILGLPHGCSFLPSCFLSLRFPPKLPVSSSSILPLGTSHDLSIFRFFACGLKAFTGAQMRLSRSFKFCRSLPPPFSSPPPFLAISRPRHEAFETSNGFYVSEKVKRWGSSPHLSSSWVSQS